MGAGILKLKPEMTGAEYNAMIEQTMHESVWGTHVVTSARSYGYMVTHFRPARHGGKDGEGEQWSTPIEGDVGYPDLTMTNGGRLIIVETKSQTGSLRASQHRWLTLLSSVSNVEVDVWRPSDSEYVHLVFQGTRVDRAHLARELAKPPVPDRLRVRRRKVRK